MKRMFLMTLFCISSIMIFAQQDHRRNPPSSVQRSWQRDYPNRNGESWEWRNNQWHTKYRDQDHNNRYVNVYYDRSGRRLYSQSEWERNDLPDAVRNRIRTRYRSDNYNAFRIERPGGRFYFQISIGNRNVYLDERGHEVRNR